MIRARRCGLSLAGCALALSLPSVPAAQAQPPAMTRPALPTAAAIVPTLDPLIARPVSELSEAVNRYAADRSALFRRYDVQYSGARGTRAREFYGEWQARLRQVDFRKLGQDARIDYLLLDSRLKYELELLKREDRKFAEMGELLPFAPRAVLRSRAAL